MNILFDLGHPAHYHLFKNFIKYLQTKNQNIHLVIRDKDVIKTLLDNDKLKYKSLTVHSNSFFGLMSEFLKRTLYLLNLQRKNKFDIALGTSVSISYLSLLSKVKNWNFNEDDDEVVKMYALLAYPFASKIINPDCLSYSKYTKNRVLYNSYHELAYLHPNNFTPDISILTKYGLEAKKYVVLRINTLKAHHDIDAKGISAEMYEKIKHIIRDYFIVESREQSITSQIDPWDMHHVLAHAKMIISDSQTMTIEAAVLGVPAVRINTFIGKSTVIDELEQNKYKLAYGFYPYQEEESLKTIEYLANDAGVDNLWQERRKKMLSEKCDFNQWMIEYFEKEINK